MAVLEFFLSCDLLNVFPSIGIMSPFFVSISEFIQLKKHLENSSIDMRENKSPIVSCDGIP